MIKTDYRPFAELFLQNSDLEEGALRSDKKQCPAASSTYYFLVCGLTKAVGLTGKTHYTGWVT